MKTPDRRCKQKASPMDTQSATTANGDRDEQLVAGTVTRGNLHRFEYPRLERFCQKKEEFAEVHGLSQSGKLWKDLSASDLPESEWVTVFDAPRCKGSKIFLNMVKTQFVDDCRLLFYKVYQKPPTYNEIYLKFATCFAYERCSAAKADPEAHKIAWALFAENVIQSLKHNTDAWKRKVDAFRDTHGPINVITTGESMPGPSMQDNVKRRPEPCLTSPAIEKLRGKILDMQSNNKAKVLMNELKEKKAEFLNKRDVLIRREATDCAASTLQREIMSLQTRYGTLKGPNATAEQLAAVEAQITAMSNEVKLIRGDDKIADMKISVESIEKDVNLLESKLSCCLHHMSFLENMMKQLTNGCTLLLSPSFYTPEEGCMNRADFYSDCVACGERLAATNAIGVYMLPCGYKYHSMCFASTLVSKQVCVQLGCNERITETVMSMLIEHNLRASPYLQEPTVSDVKTKVSASPGGAEKSSSDRKAKKPVVQINQTPNN